MKNDEESSESIKSNITAPKPCVAIEADGSVYWFQSATDLAEEYNVSTMLVCRCLESGRSINAYGVTVDEAISDHDVEF